jgi:methyl-accepting chemotaxis protein
MKIFGKLLGATLLAMAITCVVGGFGWRGLDANRSALDTVIRVRTPQIQAVDLMIETLHAIRVEELALVNSRLEPERRQQILASLAEATERLAAVRQQFSTLAMTPRQAELWAQAQAAVDHWLPKHRKMIALVADNRIVNIELLSGILAGHLLDHRQWFDDLRHAVTDRVPFRGDTNPLTCGFGRWLPTYQSEDPTLQNLLTGLRNPHERLHEAGEKISQLVARGRFKEAQALLNGEGRPALDDFQQAVEATRSYVDDRLTGFDVAINYAFGDVAKAFDGSVKALKAVSAEVTAQAVSDSERASTTGRRSQFIALAATLGGLALALALGLGLARHMARRLRRSVEVLRELEQGHLDVRLELPGKDEISDMSRAVDVFADDLQQRVRGVKGAADELVEVSAGISQASLQVDRAARSQADGVAATGTAVAEIAASVKQVGEGVAILSAASAKSTSSALEMSANSEELAGNAETLALIVDGVGSSITQMATSIQQVAANTGVLKESSDATAASVSQMQTSLLQVEKNIRETAVITEGVRRDVESGQVSVERTSAGIDDIRLASRVAGEAMAVLSDKVKNIGQILAMIDNVTDQTSLLALNATIIAAQAGEHGRGFAVVAEEIRELSERTSHSTREITAVIDSVQQETGRVVDAVARVERSVGEGEELSRASGAALTKIVTGVQDVDRRMEQIARATDEQAQGAEVIGDAMQRVSRMVDQTVGATREQSLAAGSITTAVEQLRELALQLKNAAREQSSGSKVIAVAMEEIDEMIRRINLASAEQVRGGQQIGQAMEEIRRFAEANLTSTDLLQEAVSSQHLQIKVLREQMGAFRIEAAQVKAAGDAGDTGESAAAAGARPQPLAPVPLPAGPKGPHPAGRGDAVKFEAAKVEAGRRVAAP